MRKLLYLPPPLPDVQELKLERVRETMNVSRVEKFSVIASSLNYPQRKETLSMCQQCAKTLVMFWTPWSSYKKVYQVGIL